MVEVYQLLEKSKSHLEESWDKYRENKDQQCVEIIINEITDNLRNINKEILKDSYSYHLYMDIIKDLVNYSLILKNFTLGESIYKRLCPGFGPHFVCGESLEKKEQQWTNHPTLVMHYFIIHHHLHGIKEKYITSMAIALRMFRHYMGFMDTNKPLFIEMLFDTHELWKEELTLIEEERLWIEISDWIIQDFLNIVQDDLNLYKKAKKFYNDYKKTKRLNPFTYRLLEYIILIIGVGEKKQDYSILVEKATIIIKQIKREFCECYGEQIAEILNQILVLWLCRENYKISDFYNFQQMMTEINGTPFKKEVFYDSVLDAIDLDTLFERKAFSTIVWLYKEGMISEVELNKFSFIIAYSLSEQEEEEEAKIIYEEMIKRGQDSGAIYNNLAVIYRDLDKNYDKALEYFEFAATKEPEKEIYQRNIKKTLEIIKHEKNKPKRQIDNYFKKTDKQLKSICFTIYKLENLIRIDTDDIEKATSFKGRYLKNKLLELENLELITYDKEKGWRLEPPILEKVKSYIDPKLERQIIRNNQALMYRPIFYHETEILLYRVLTEIFPQHLVFPNMDLKAIIDVQKIRDHIDLDILDYLFKAHVDFAIIDTTSYFPILTFERDSEYQDIEPQKTNAAKKNMIFEVSGLPLIRIRYNSAMDYERLKEEIKQATKEFILQISHNTDSESRRILESIEPKRFGIIRDFPNTEELEESWIQLVGKGIAAHTKCFELDKEHLILKITVEEIMKQVLDLGLDNIKSQLYQQYPILNSIQFYWI